MKSKTKRLTALVLTILMAASVTACSSSGTVNESSETASTTAETSVSSTDTSSLTADELNNKINDLYQEENKIFSEHKDVWDKAFVALQDSTAEYTENYADFLAASIEESKDSFTEDELNTLNEGIEKYRVFENQRIELQAQLDAMGESSEESSSDSSASLQDISGVDFDGNEFDGSIFSNNAVTVVNFWFTSCKPCVAELSKLNELNETLKDMGGEVVGINTDTSNGYEAAIKEAKEVLESQGASYRNLSVNKSSKAGDYMSTIMAFPTTVLVDRNGNIVGEPLLGGIDNEDNYNTLMEQIKTVIAADSAN